MYEKFYITSPMGTHYLNWPCKFEAGCGCLPSRQRLAAFVSFDLGLSQLLSEAELCPFTCPVLTLFTIILSGHCC
jgi:hypothetical protein